MVEPRNQPLSPGRRRRVGASRTDPALLSKTPERPEPTRLPPAVAELRAHLGMLRTSLEEVLARVRSRLVARLERLEQAAADPALPPSLAEDMGDEITRARVSSKKGRVKDLVRLKSLLDELCDELDRESPP
ncbi:MAG: hypothetical protein KA072_09695 [Thermoanaerobaculaceae bacterium]|nr:hypothetical protein [Thermoanaerobaculaceae bacterium]MDI9622697.1 hypothetical protein [Acidobacteriota bacterium]NLH09746.1 hypothetical protein [Holophagae bacterium]HPW56040.1 hypothetical protein [Thermoanaerobaculaceae bacterium]